MKFSNSDSEIRHFFKYEYGYINIDSENIYLTHTGNWSETVNMEAKNNKTIQKSTKRKWWILSCIIIGSGLIYLFHFLEILSVGKSIILILFIPLNCLPLYKYMRSELGQKFLIPIKNITSIENENSGLRINFRNEVFEDDTVYLEYPRGLDKEFLQQLLAEEKD